jgi:hypothetical protein
MAPASCIVWMGTSGAAYTLIRPSRTCVAFKAFDGPGNRAVVVPGEKVRPDHAVEVELLCSLDSHQDATVARPADVLAAVNKANAVLAQTATLRAFMRTHGPLIRQASELVKLAAARRLAERRVCEAHPHVTYRRGRRAG